ncbi:hypothetical protein CcaverHIS002_0608270 [Cutaneotrichosporon cavernicola]|uniref:N-acetyltransferase domain-containing protein n=1 Tax=Cutaneotrichosporon cavernicola TaxID=279322 RepID=A0AA48L983_9TREE|nr:uncharacterized protein CcaverHIS019_0607720 [Cutaneotrichosporon cavernicola]BEI86540.1 hypothetical protein CcaverHIS002_0608270 [Cutaneotrichosporon cavernicola]BEI94313.1 hypothetical protein CcaverHIS019_0607720 [Cutaneotrichosporon cavernicola]BEJ02090.1 hypothetical protein CcaverHIS631_0607720 [Cutaneotrichosporon cavernicola]BEJ09853.1 hypothetical protein CcaverHIS641_0607680 [Cutaneotrichosporon cavernicola]
MTVTVRFAQSADKQQFLDRWELYNQFYKRTVPADVTEEQWRRFLDPSSPVYCAVAVDSDKEDGANVIGFVTWLPHIYTGSIEDVVYLHDLWSDEAQRNVGTGRKLMEFVYADSKAKGIKRVYWHTQHFNHRAQLLYTKVGTKTDFVQYSHDV